MFKRIVIAFIIWKFMLFGFALVASSLLPLQRIGIALNSSFGLPYFQWVWGNFDGVNYVEIARSGYQYPNYAFFPLYPLLISLGKKIFLTFRTLQMGLLISNISLFLSLFLLYRITRLDYNKNISYTSIVLLLVFPTALFYGAAYADSLYLFLSLAAFFSARKQQWLLAGIFGFLAGLTRLIGIVLVPALILEWYMQKKVKSQKSKVKSLLRDFFKEKVFFLFLIPLGIISYGLYLQINFGNFFLFQQSMAVWHQEKFVFPLQVIFRYIKIFLTASPTLVYFVATIEFVSTFAYLWLSVYVLRKIRLSYGVFMLLTLLIPIFTGTLQSMPRYILHLFPAFIALSLFTSGSKKVLIAVVLVFLLLQFIFVSLFTRGYFIA